MVPFAGWEMPVQYPAGILAEHLHTRSGAGLFDVSHMGQIVITGPDPAAALERLVPGDIQALVPGKARYTVFTDVEGGVLDDLIVTRDAPDRLFVVVNAGRFDHDLAHLKKHLEPGHTVTWLQSQALLALQGPQAVACVARMAPDVLQLGFMESVLTEASGLPLRISRLGYTGEDGVEVSLSADYAAKFARTLLAMEEVRPVGLGARDSLRLEAGLALYGHDLDPQTSPVEAGLAWTIGKRRRAEGGYPGDVRVAGELADGPARRLVGIRPDGRAPAREGTAITTPDGEPIGTVTSGGFGPTVGAPIAMGYVAAAHAAIGTPLQLVVRGKGLPATVAELPFVPHRYVRPQRRQGVSGS